MNTKLKSTISSDKLAELILKARLSREISFKLIKDSEKTIEINSSKNNEIKTGVDKTGKLIDYNKNQLDFMKLASTGKSCILIGAAGTGKTTCMRGAVSSLITCGLAGILNSQNHKYLPQRGSPGIVAVSFTRRAVANLRKTMSEDMKGNCLTIHALLEYQPVYYEVYDEISGESKKTMRFEATRNLNNPLPDSIRVCIIDESSMVSTDLFKELSDALPKNCQFIFLGDIQQLPPVFGPAILGYKMLELPTVELTEVYRQALESPIIRLAHRILSGKSIISEEFTEWKFPNQLTIHPWKKKLSSDMALITIAKFLTTAIENNLYDPEEDMVLMPFNKACGTIELNKHIAQYMARKRNATVYEIIAGFSKLYLSVGDKVLYDKEDALITNIKINLIYAGKLPCIESKTLDYWGYDKGIESESNKSEEVNDENDIDFLLSQSMALSNNSEERVRQASHVVTVEILETGQTLDISAAGDLNALLLSYALTVHKSQGSEFRKVFLMLHQSHNTMLQRELLYTAVTRAKEELYIICEPESFIKGIISQRIKGNTLAEKAEYFKGKQEKLL